MINEDVFIKNVKINYEGVDLFIHTIECGVKNSLNLVMLHGYGTFFNFTKYVKNQ